MLGFFYLFFFGGGWSWGVFFFYKADKCGELHLKALNQDRFVRTWNRKLGNISPRLPQCCRSHMCFPTSPTQGLGSHFCTGTSRMQAEGRIMEVAGAAFRPPALQQNNIINSSSNIPSLCHLDEWCCNELGSGYAAVIPVCVSMCLRACVRVSFHGDKWHTCIQGLWNFQLKTLGAPNEIAGNGETALKEWEAVKEHHQKLFRMLPNYALMRRCRFVIQMSYKSQLLLQLHGDANETSDSIILSKAPNDKQQTY